MSVVWYCFILLGLFINIFCADFIPDHNHLFSWGIIAVISLISFLGLAKDFKDKQLLIIAFCAYFFRILLMIWDIYCSDIFRLPNSGLDAKMFEGAAYNGYYFNEFGRGGFYARFISNVIYGLFGVQPMIAIYTNILFSITSMGVIIKSLELLKVNYNVIKISLIIIAFLPNFAIINSILLRESIIFFFITVSVFNFIRWFMTNRGNYFILAIIFCLIGATFHSGAIAPILGYIIMYILYDPRYKKIKLNTRTITAILVILIGTIAVFPVIEDTVLVKFQSIENLDDITKVADSYNAGGSAYDIGINTGNTTLDLVINTPIRMIYFVLSPMPWDWRGMNDVIGFCFSSLFYGISLVLALRGLKNQKMNKNDLTVSQQKIILLTFLILALASALIFAWGTSNAGSALRHRDKFMCIYLILFAVSLNLHYKLKNI